ncbi:MAG: SpoIVB peptidase S55 domain-containing protein [Paludibaculum sp.]
MLRSSPIFLVPLLAAALQGQTGGILPLREVQPGMKAIGRSVFAGMKVEEFQVEVLGVLENAGPKQSIILARLSGAGLEKTGVMQGMSGSPVYYNGRLMGAVALSFPFSKEPIAGIRPIEEMLTVSPSTRQTAEVRFPYDGRETLPRSQGLEVGPQRMMEIATPFWLSGFTRNTVDYFAPALRAAGLEPVQGVSGGGRAVQGAGSAKTPLVPGSMISVQLVRGDLNVGADGTVTHLDGNRVYAFGHRFLAIGDTEMPFARSEVITLLASNNQSFKISTPANGLAASRRTVASPSRANLAKRPT